MVKEEGSKKLACYDKPEHDSTSQSRGGGKGRPHQVSTNDSS